MESLKQKEQREGYEATASKEQRHLDWLNNWKTEYELSHGHKPDDEDIYRICKSTYVNTYETDRAYGGNEEGGWWYDCGEPVESIYYQYRYEAEDSFPEIEDKWKNLNEIEGRKHPSSVSCDGFYQTYFSDDYAKPYPSSIPRYE